MECEEKFPIPIIKEEVVEKNEDIIDLGDFDEYEWNTQVQQKLKEYVASESEATLDTLMKWYIGTLKDIMNFEDIMKLKQFLRDHLTSFKLYFKDLNCSFRDNYLDNVENILAVYINFHIRCIPKKATYSYEGTYKKSTKCIVRKLMYFAATQLLGREDLLSHVLMKMKINESTVESKDILNLIYRKLLTVEPEDKSELSFCRTYILFQKWKKIREPEEWERMDKLMYTMYDKTPECLQQNAILKKILSPQSNSFLDVLTVINENYVVISDRYFKFIKNEPIQEGRVLSIEGLYLDSISLHELHHPQIVEFIEENNNSHYDDYLKNLVREKNHEYDNAASTSIDVVDLVETTPIKEEDDDDDCQIVNIEFPKPSNVQLIHEYIDDDDDIVEIIMPDIYLKKDKGNTSFLESISESSSNQVDTLNECQKESTEVTFLDSIVSSGSSNEDSILVEESCSEISNSKKANNFQSEKRNHAIFNNNVFDSSDLIPHSPPRKSDCVLKGILKKSFSSEDQILSEETFLNINAQSDRESVEVIPTNTSKSVSSVETQTEPLMEQNDDFIMSQRQSEQPSTKHRNEEPNQSSTISISTVQIFNSNIELTNAVQDSENQVLDNSSRVDSTASCSLELLPQVNSDLIDENTHQKPDSNQVDSPENSNLSEKGAMDNESARPVEANAHIDSSLFPLSPILSLTNKSRDGDTYKSLASPDISSTSVDIQEHLENNSSENASPRSCTTSCEFHSDVTASIIETNENIVEESTAITNRDKDNENEHSIDLNLNNKNMNEQEPNFASSQDEQGNKDKPSVVMKELTVLISKDDQSEPDVKKNKVMFTSPRKVIKDFSISGKNVHLLWNQFKDSHGLHDFLSGPVTDKVSISNGCLSLNDSLDWFGNSNKVTTANVEQTFTSPPTSTSPNTSSEITSPAFEEGLDDFRTFFEEKHETIKSKDLSAIKEKLSDYSQKLNSKQMNNISKHITVRSMKSLQPEKRKRILFSDDVLDSDNLRSHSPSDGSNRVIQGILKKSTPAVKKLRSFIVPESISYIPVKKSSIQMDNLKNHSKTENNNSVVKNMLRKTFEEEENVGYYSPPDINGDLQNIDVIKKNPSLDTSTKRSLRPRIPKRLLNMKSLDMYNVKLDDICIQGDPCVIVEKLPQEEIDRRLKLSEISRKLRLERERRQQSSHPISALVRVDYDKHTTHICDKDVVRFNSPNPWQVTVSSPNSWRNVSSPYPEHEEEGTVSSCNFDLSENSCILIQCQNVCSCENLAFKLTKLKISRKRKRKSLFYCNFVEKSKSVSYSYPAYNSFLSRPKKRKKRKHSAKSINNSVPNCSSGSDFTESCKNLNSSVSIDLSFVNSIVENFDKESSDFMLDVNPSHFDKENVSKEHSELEDLENIVKSEDLSKNSSIPADLHNLNLRKFSPSPVIHCVSPRSNSPNQIIITEYDSQKHLDYSSDFKKLDNFTIEYNSGTEKVEYICDLSGEKLNNSKEPTFGNNDPCSDNSDMPNYQVCDYSAADDKNIVNLKTININLTNVKYEFDIKDMNLTNCLSEKIGDCQMTIGDLATKTISPLENYLTANLLQPNKSEIMNNSYGDENANLSFEISKETNLTYATQCKLSDIENASLTQKLECINSAGIKTDDKCEEPFKEQTNIDKSNTVANKTDANVLDLEDTETRLPLKKRKLSTVANSKDEMQDDDDDDNDYLGPDLVEEIIRRARAEKVEKDDISYPAKPMISIAEIQETLSEPQPRIFKTPAEKKEMPPPVQTINTPKIVTEQYNNHTYNNPTINYHMNNVPYPFFPCASLSYFPSILLPINSTTTFDMNLVPQPMKKQEGQITQEPVGRPKKEKRSRGRKKNI